MHLLAHGVIALLVSSPSLLQEVESKYLNFLSRHSSSHGKRLRHLSKLSEQAGEYGALLRRELAQDPLLGPLNAKQVWRLSIYMTAKRYRVFRE